MCRRDSSGGVDSSVVAALLLRAIGEQLTCVHVNHGLLRKGEPEQEMCIRDRFQLVAVLADGDGGNIIPPGVSTCFNPARSF